MTPRDFARALSTLRVSVESQDKAHAFVLDIHERSNNLDPCIVFLIGDAGAGKTTVARRIKGSIEAKGHPAGTMPVLIVNVPQGCTRKSVLAEGLAELGHPDPDKTGFSAGKLERLFAKWCKKNSVQLIIFEEAQQMVPTTNNEKRDGELADLQKMIANRTLVPLILIGDKDLDVLCKNPMFHRRLRGRKWLKPFKYKTIEDQVVWRAFLGAFDEKLPYAYFCGFEGEEFATALYEATGGLPGWLKQMLTGAFDAAGPRAKRLEPKHFTAAWDELRAFMKPDAPNPFRNVPTPPLRAKNRPDPELARAA